VAHHRRHPKDQGSHDVLGRVLYAAGQKEAARPHLEAACVQAAREKGKPAPGEAASADALVALADLELTAGKRDAAKPLVARAKAAGAKRAPVVQARLQAKDGDLSGAERTLAGYLAQNTSDGDALAAGADIAYERGQYPQARERFEKALGLLPKGALTATAQGRLCDVRVRDAAYAEAKEACEGALKGGADTASVHASYGLALYRSGDKKAGKAELDAAAKKGAKDPAVHGALGAIAAEEGREAEVLSEYDQVLAQEPNNAEANAATGRVLEKRGQHKDASARLSKAFNANPDNALLGADLAKAQLGAGQLAAAQKTMGQIPQDALPPAVFHGLRGRVENKLGNYKRADEEYAKAQEKAPDDAELHKLRGQNFLKMPNYDRAIPALEKARQIDPQNLEVAQELTRLYSETGQTEKVAKTLGAVQTLEKEKVASRKKELKPEDVRRISFQDNLVAKSGADGALAPALSERVTADISQSAYVELVDLREQMAVERQREAIDRDDKLSQEEKDKAIAALPHTAADRERDRIINSQLSQEEKLKAIEGLKGKEKVAQWALAGDYRIEGDTLFVNLKAQRLVNPVTKSSLESGPKANYAQVEKRAVIGLLKNLDIPLAPDEEAALGRTEGLPNLDSAVLTQQADELVKKGDVDSLRKATELYKRARDADQGNAQALVGLDKSLADIAEKNRLMVLDPRPIGEVPESLQDMVKLTLQSKLSGVRGVRVVEGLKKSATGEELPENDSVAKELDRLAKEPDTFDPASYDIAKIGQVLGANVLVKTEVVKNGEDLVLNARLHEIKDGKLLVTYGTQRAGKMADQQKLQADLAKDIAQYLRGEPSDEEKAALAAVKDKDDYKKQMDELAKLRAAENARKEALAQKAAQPKTPEAKAAEAAKPPEEKKPAVVALGPVSVPESGDDRTYNVFMASARLSSLTYNGDKNASLGVLLSHTAKRWGHNRLSVLLDFESTRVVAGRSLDQNTSRAAFYGAGADYTVPIAFGGTGLFLGAEAMLGLAQGQRGAQPITTGYALTVAPHAGLALAYKGVGLTADLGYRFAFGGGDGIGLGGFFLQAGVRRETPSNEPSRHGAFELGYTAHLFVPNNSALANYGSIGFVGGGAALQHTLTLLSQGGSLRNGAWLSYGASNGTIDGTKMTRAEASWAFILNAFDTEDLFNLYIGLRLGVLGAKAGSSDAEFKWGVLGAPMAGLDLQLFKGFVVGVGASYDASTAKTSSDASFDGYAIDASATLRF
jgi:superkiller protein 3